jgi:hypothetical protein
MGKQDTIEIVDALIFIGFAVMTTSDNLIVQLIGIIFSAFFIYHLLK